MKAKTPDHLLVIGPTRMRAAGLADGEYESAGNTVEVVGGVSDYPTGNLLEARWCLRRGFS